MLLAYRDSGRERTIYHDSLEGVAVEHAEVEQEARLKTENNSRKK